MIVESIAAGERPLVEVAPEGAATRVWLRENQERDVADSGPDGGTEFWRCDEVTGTLPGAVTAEEAEARFAELWAAWSVDGVPVEERVAAAEDAVAPMPAVYALARMQAVALTDEQALEVPSLFGGWEAGAAYAAGDRRTHGGVLYKCLQAHTSQAGWEPGAAPSLWARVLPGQSGEVGEWVQPGATNGYAKGDRVTHGGKTWESTVYNNVWEPGTIGAPWVEVPSVASAGKHFA